MTTAQRNSTAMVPEPGTWLPRRTMIGSRIASLKPHASTPQVAWQTLRNPSEVVASPLLHALRTAPVAPSIDMNLVRKLISERRRDRRPGDDEAVKASLATLSQHGYRSLIGDLFRREGYDVLAAEGPDADVIDLELVAKGKRWLVNCQLREVEIVELPALIEMTKVVRQNKSDGAFVFTDGSFQPRAESFARSNALVLIDGELLLNMVVELALEDARKENLTLKLKRSLNSAFGHELRHALLAAAIS